MLKALSELINILEADIPANPRSAKNQKLIKPLQRLLAKYFKDMGNAFPYSKLDELYTRYVKESAGGEAEDILDPIIKAFQSKIIKEISGQLVEIYLSGMAEMVDWGKTKGGIPISYEGPPMQAAIDWADKYGAKLVTKMDEETKRRLANVISQGIENKRGVPGISRDLRQTFTDMAKYRSDMIARTETANALSQSSLDAMNDMGVDGKEWVWGGTDCDICEENEAKGVIPVDDVFPSGHEAPPAHPNCTCAIAPAIIKR